MDRRQFTQALAASALAVTSPALPANAQAESPSADGATPFPLSVMLWTVFKELPFEERLAKVAEAGYTAACAVRDLTSSTTDDVLALSRITVTPELTAARLREVIGGESTRLDALVSDARAVASRALRRAKLKRRGPDS